MDEMKTGARKTSIRKYVTEQKAQEDKPLITYESAISELMSDNMSDGYGHASRENGPENSNWHNTTFVATYGSTIRTARALSGSVLPQKTGPPELKTLSHLPTRQDKRSILAKQAGREEIYSKNRIRRKSINRDRGKMISRHVARSTKSVRNVVTAGNKIKEAAKTESVKTLMQSEDASDMVTLIGKKGVVRTVQFLEITGRFMMTVIKNLLKAMISLFGAYFIIAATLIIILIPFLAGLSGSASSSDFSSDTINISEDSDESAAAGRVETPRTGGRSTLTYQEVHNSKWYSSRFGITPFSGGIGLDKLIGERGGNCTAYVWGRRCEIEGTRTQLGSSGDAYYWYDRELAAGIYKCGQSAKPGAVACWSYGYNQYGHVAIVEEIKEDGSIVTSNSAFGSHTGVPILFYPVTYTNETALKTAYAEFKGYIYVEKIANDNESWTDTESATETGSE